MQLLADDPFALHLLPAQDVAGVAAAGTQGPGQALPHGERIQESFGRHDVSGVRAHVGGAAAEAAAGIGARAYAMGNDVAFADAPDLHTAAHEAAHVVQQRGGVQLYGGVGQAGDRYEQHADAVADAVVRGESAEALLDGMAGGSQRAHSHAAGAVQRKKGDDGATSAGSVSASPTSDAAAFAAPMTELAMHAKAVVDAAEMAYLPLTLGKVLEAAADVERVKQALTALAEFLHQNAQLRSANDEAALRAALRAAQSIANMLASQHGPHRKAEVELHKSMAKVAQVLRENTAREATLESPDSLAGMVEDNLTSLQAWKGFAAEHVQQLPGLDVAALDGVLATTAEWVERLRRDRGAAANLSRAIVDQNEIVTTVSAELQQVIKQPVSATTKDTINGYLLVLAHSTGRRQRTDAMLQQARAMRRRLPLDRAAAALESDYGQGLAIEQLDGDAGRRAQAEHAALSRRHARLEARIAGGGRVSRSEMDDFVLATREYEFFHRVDLLRLQAKQTLDAIDAVGGSRTAAKVKAQRKLTELMHMLEGVRMRYQNATAEDADDSSADVRTKKRTMLHAMEAQLQHGLAEDDFEGTLKEGDAVIQDQIVSTFISQLVWTIALTVSGNFVAAAARGAGAAVAEGLGASMVTTQRVAAIGAFTAEATYGAVTQKYLQGDPGSLTSLLAVNAPMAATR